MRTAGINWMAVIVAAIAVYAVGFVIYALLIPEATWSAMMDMTDAEKALAMSRMMYGPVMPILTAVCFGILFKWGAVEDMVTGIKWGVLIALASAIPTILYGWVYGGHDTNVALIDTAHLWLGHAVAGAIIGGWR